MSIKVRYKDVAIGADKNAVITTSTKAAFSDTSKIPFGIDAPALATCELNGWGLSPDYIIRDSENVAFWSNNLSGSDCTFSTVPMIMLEWGQQYTSTGLTIQFDVNGGDYCRKISVLWHQGETTKDGETFYPDGPFFTLNRTVEAFDRITIYFEESNLPRKRCKVDYIGIGVVRDFSTKELKSVKAIHEIDLISSTVPVNILDASVHSRDEVDYIFQKKQPVEAYDGNKLIGVYYIDKGEITGRLDMRFTCSDKIGLLDLEQYEGGLWLTDTPLLTMLADIFGDVSIFDIDPLYAESKLRGYIPPGKKREALQHIVFALGAVVDTSGSDLIKIFPLPNNTAVEISPKKTYTGGKVTTSDTVTAVEVSAFEITEETPGNGDKSIEFEGIKYKANPEVVRVENPDTVTSDPANVKKFDKCYLVNSDNVQQIANNIMEYYRKRDKYSFKHVLDGQEVGHQYSALLPWGDETPSGIITKMTVTTSNITVSDTEMVLND